MKTSYQQGRKDMYDKMTERTSHSLSEKNLKYDSLVEENEMMKAKLEKEERVHNKVMWLSAQDVARLESQLEKERELLQRIFDYHISHGFGDDHSFDSFADEIAELEELEEIINLKNQAK